MGSGVVAVYEYELPVPSGLKVSPSCRWEMKLQQGHARAAEAGGWRKACELECPALANNKRRARGSDGVNECTGEQ